MHIEDRDGWACIGALFSTIACVLLLGASFYCLAEAAIKAVAAL